MVNDAGKTLIQVIDNGKGMSPSDARMAFERHATSKIQHIEDLFKIKTMGFRGEALASIAAVSKVELKTKRKEDESGTFIELENSKVQKQEPIAFNNGTSIAMKNLFFNIPARRNFLKSNTAELKHIVDEFIRVAMAFPDLLFTLQSNGQEVFHLEKGTCKQRIVQILGNNYNAKLVSVQEQTDYLNITGFVGKPETAKKTRGDQYLFVNNRFIKSAYLNHAIMNAFSDMIPKDSYPMYVLFIDLDPSQLDINVHPTKQEIKFEDDKIVYAFVQASVKHALAQFSITPTLDFDLDPSIEKLDSVSKPFTEAQKNFTTSSSIFQSFTQKNQAHFIDRKSDLKNWKDFYDTSLGSQQNSAIPSKESKMSFSTKEDELDYPIVQLLQTYLVTQKQSGFYVIHQQNAHERVLYERYMHAMAGKPIATQQSLFPATIELSATDAILLQELLPDMQELGYQLESFGKNTFVIQGTPADVDAGDDKIVVEKIIEQYKHFSHELKFSKREKLIRSMALQKSIKVGTTLTQKEMQQLVIDIFSCETSNSSPNGKPTYMTFDKEELDKIFGR